MMSDGKAGARESWHQLGCAECTCVERRCVTHRILYTTTLTRRDSFRSSSSSPRRCHAPTWPSSFASSATPYTAATTSRRPPPTAPAPHLSPMFQSSTITGLPLSTSPGMLTNWDTFETTGDAAVDLDGVMPMPEDEEKTMFGSTQGSRFYFEDAFLWWCSRLWRLRKGPRSTITDYEWTLMSFAVWNNSRTSDR
jgi:hypothetical protein